MHEFSLCDTLLQQVEQLARQQHARRVTSIFVSAGELSGLEPELMQKAFQLKRGDTVAAEASLNIAIQPVSIHCLECGENSTARAQDLRCPRCHSDHTRMLAGTELWINKIEIERD